jgi:peptidoglycan/xylan/chitin deacetylase (PgdA/CDA1 family)
MKSKKTIGVRRIPSYALSKTVYNKSKILMKKFISRLMVVCLIVVMLPSSSLVQDIENNVKAEPEPQAKILFTFDDGWRGQIDFALPLLREAGFAATAYVNKKTIDGSDPAFMREQDLRDLYAAGWDIGNHTVSHYSTTATDPATLVRLTSEYLDNQTWIENNIGNRGARHICYPSGSFMPEYLPVFRGIGALTGRTTVQTNLTTPVSDPAEYFQLPIKSVSSTSVGSIDRTKSAITAAVNDGKTIILMLHNVQPVIGSLVTTVDDLKSIIDLVKGYSDQNLLQVMTISSWYSQQILAVPPVPVSPPAPDLIMDDTLNRIVGMTGLMEYRIDPATDTDAYSIYDDSSFSQLDLSGEHKVEVRYKAAGINPPGPSVILAFTGLLDPPPPKARIIFTFDDGWKDQMTYALPILHKAGFPAVAYINRDSIIGTNPVEMRPEDLRVLYANGWDIGNHTTNHDSTTLTDPDTISRLQLEYLDNQIWIEQNVGTRGARHACYPSGSYMPEYIDMLKGIGALTARTTEQANIMTPVTDPDTFYKLTIKSVSSNTGSIDRTKTAIDTAVQDGSTVILMLHKVEPEYGDLVTTVEDLQLLVDYVGSYVSKKQIEVVTMSQWYYEQTGTNQPVPEKPPLPAVFNDDVDNTVLGMTFGMEYDLDGSGFVGYDPLVFGSLSFAGDHTLLVRYAACGINPAGDSKLLTFTANQTDPDPLAAAKVLFTFDGDWKGQLDYALPILNAAGFKATTYIMRDAAYEGDPDLMDLNDLKILHSNGWDIANHTTTHNDNGDQTDEANLTALRKDYLENQNWIIDNIGSPGAWHAAYPSGRYSEQLIDILQDIGVRTARTTREENQVIPISLADDFYKLPCEPFSSDPRYTDVKSVKNAVQDAVNTGSTVIIFMNQVLPEYHDGNVTVDDLQTVIDFVKQYSDQGLVSVMTISQWYRWQISHFPVEGALPDPGDPPDPPQEPVTPPLPELICDDELDTVTGMSTEMEYSLDGAEYVIYDPSEFAVLDLSGDHTLLVRYAASGINPCGPALTLVFTAAAQPPPPPGNVIFTFDRGWQSQYTTALPILQAAGFKATAYVCRDYARSTNPNWMRLTALKSLYTSGWDIGNMTTNYDTNGYLTTKTALNKLKKEYLDNRNWIRTSIGIKGSDQIAYPAGAYSSQLITRLQDIDAVSGRTMAEGYISESGPLNLFMLPVVKINGSSESVSKASAAIEQAALTGSTVILQIEGVAAIGNELNVSIDDFQQIVDLVGFHVSEGRLQVPTVSEWVSRQ